jgi:hypothetical protein
MLKAESRNVESRKHELKEEGGRQTTDDGKTKM